MSRNTPDGERPGEDKNCRFPTSVGGKCPYGENYASCREKCHYKPLQNQRKQEEIRTLVAEVNPKVEEWLRQIAREEVRKILNEDGYRPNPLIGSLSAKGTDE